MEQKDYYRILGVDNHAGQKQIRDAYRKLAFEYHPDRNKENPAAAEKMKELNEAYAVISNPAKRKDYDALRQQYGSFAYSRFRQNYSEQDIFRGSDINQIFEEMGRVFGFRSFDDIFKEFYGSGYQSFQFGRPGFFGKGFVFVKSTEKDRQQAPKFALGGSLGRFIKYGLKKLWGVELPEKGSDWYDVITIDPELAKAGGKIKYSHRKKSKELLIKIPSGIKTDRIVRLRKMGDEGKGGGEPGDLFLKVRVRTSLLQKIKSFLKRLIFK
jgi:DnaJ-class molecular chaperone